MPITQQDRSNNGLGAWLNALFDIVVFGFPLDRGNRKARILRIIIMLLIIATAAIALYSWLNNR